MRHGFRARRTVERAAQWYREWEGRQLSDAVFVINGRTILVRPEQFERARQLLLDEAQKRAGTPGFAPFELLRCESLPAPQWRNRELRRREKREARRRKVRAALEQARWEAEAVASANLIGQLTGANPLIQLDRK